MGPPPFYRGRRTAEAFPADGGQHGERAREENARTTKDTKISFSDSRHCPLSPLGLPERRWSFVFFVPFVVRTFLCSRRLADAREEAVDAFGESLGLGSDHGEALARIARTRRLVRRAEREAVGLAGDRLREAAPDDEEG